MSTKDSEISAYVALKDLAQLDKEIPNPRIIIFFYLPQYEGVSYRLIQISEEVKKICLETKKDFLRLEEAKEKLKAWCDDRKLPYLREFSHEEIKFNDYSIIGNSIWAAGAGYLICSLDGGDTWEIKFNWNPRVMTPSGFSAIEALRVYFFNENEGLFVTSLAVLKTSDGGNKWHPLLDVRNLKAWDGATQIESAVIKDRQSIILILWLIKDKIETRDGGKTWEFYSKQKKIRLQTGNKGKTWQRID